MGSLNKFKYRAKEKKGFSIIEALIFLFIFSITVVTFYQTFSLGTNYIIESRKRIAATELAKERMEIIRSLEYDAIGTVSGSPSGDIIQNEVVTRGSITYTIKTFITYKDDPYDGTQSDTDSRPTDYKAVRVEVDWGDGSNPNKIVTMTGLFAAAGLEPPISGGIMSINLIDNQGIGIADVNVDIINSGVGINIQDVKTDSSGNILLYDMPESNQEYQVSVSKSGYNSLITYPPYPTNPDFDPVDIHGSSVSGTMNTISFIIDQLSDFTIVTEDVFGNSVPNVEFSLKGGKKLGSTVVSLPDEPEDVFVFDEDSLDSGSSGESDFNDMIFGEYYFTFKEPVSNYEFIYTDKGDSDPGRFSIAPGSSEDVTVLLADKSVNSVFVRVARDDDGTAIEGADVRLKNDTLLYDETLVSDSFGYAYFPVDTTPLVADQYELTVDILGFDQYSNGIDVSGLIIEDANMQEST